MGNNCNNIEIHHPIPKSSFRKILCEEIYDSNYPENDILYKEYNDWLNKDITQNYKIKNLLEIINKGDINWCIFKDFNGNIGIEIYKQKTIIDDSFSIKAYYLPKFIESGRICLLYRDQVVLPVYFYISENKLDTGEIQIKNVYYDISDDKCKHLKIRKGDIIIGLNMHGLGDFEYLFTRKEYVKQIGTAYNNMCFSEFRLEYFCKDFQSGDQRIRKSKPVCFNDSGLAIAPNNEFLVQEGEKLSLEKISSLTSEATDSSKKRARNLDLKVIQKIIYTIQDKGENNLTYPEFLRCLDTNYIHYFLRFAKIHLKEIRIDFKEFVDILKNMFDITHRKIVAEALKSCTFCPEFYDNLVEHVNTE